MIYIFLFFVVLVLKIFIFIYFSMLSDFTFGGGSDSDYYDSYALGEVSEAANVWPVLLRVLNDLELYSRAGVSYFLGFLGIIFIPLLIGQLASVDKSPVRNRVFWLAAIVVGVYPTLFFYTFDIYRDVFMVFIFALSLFVVKGLLNSSSIIRKIGYLILFFCFVFFLYLLRPYLGVSLFIAFFFMHIFKVRRMPLGFWVIGFLLLLNIFFILGILDPIIIYRESFDSMDGGSSIGIRFDSAVTFLPEFVLSFLSQMLGLYFPNIFSVIVFIIEGVPFSIALIYLVINRQHLNSFAAYLVLFAIIYSSIWLLGNDNLGTAVRLRMYSYISIFLSVAIVFQRKYCCSRLSA